MRIATLLALVALASCGGGSSAPPTTTTSSTTPPTEQTEHAPASPDEPAPRSVPVAEPAGAMADPPPVEPPVIEP